MIKEILISGLLLSRFSAFFKEDPKALFGVYQQPGKFYQIKYFLFLCLITFRKWWFSGGSSGGGQGAKNIADVEKIEKPQLLSEHPLGFDATFFIGANSKGYRLILGTERRHNGLVHGVFYIVIPNRGLFCLPQLPDTSIFSTENGEEGKGFQAAGIKNEPITPQKLWKLSYNGEVRQGDKLYPITVDADFSSDFKILDFDCDLDSSSISKSIANEKWTREYFEVLKHAHQTHYEQMGVIKANIKFDGEIHKIEMKAFRDHSFGHKRDWTLMHRYAFFILFFEDGKSLSIGIISQPSTGSVLDIGYVCSADGIYEPMKWTDFKLYQHGENGVAPQDISFQFRAGEKFYHLNVEVEHQSEHFVGANWEARMVERFVKCKLDGVPGYGVSEFHYNNKNGRPEKYTVNDPKWYKNLKK